MNCRLIRCLPALRIASYAMRFEGGQSSIVREPLRHDVAKQAMVNDRRITHVPMCIHAIRPLFTLFATQGSRFCLPVRRAVLAGGESAGEFPKNGLLYPDPAHSLI